MTATPTQFEILATAVNMLEWHDNLDRQKPGLLELTGVSQHGRATMSGLNDYDYQSLAYLKLDDAHNLKQLRTVTKSAIPNEILEHFKHVKCHCNMGLFPEIGRAWLTIDSEIYIWTYNQTRDVAYYDGLSHLIVSVGLVKPKPDVFVKDVMYLLVMTTPIEVIVLGVTFGENSHNEMQLMNRPIFVIGTDNVSISVIKGTDDGRIFLGGRDGCLYEVFYQAESSWFGKRCKKINHSQNLVSYMVPNFLKVFSEVDPIQRIAIDNSRRLLYVLTEHGSIEAWDIGTNYANVRRLSRITQNEITSRAVSLITTVDPSIFKSVKAICPLIEDDSNKLHLVAFTQCGVRLYFSTTSLNISQQSPNATTPSPQAEYCGQTPVSGQTESSKGLYLLHVRLPPGYTPNATTNKPKEVHVAHCSDETMLMITTQQQDQDLLWSLTSVPSANHTYLMESTALESLDGIVWGLAEVHDPCRPLLNSPLYKARNPRRIALLTNQGTHIIELLKSADILLQILLACNGPHNEEVKMFFQSQDKREACATCLLLATSEKYRGGDVALLATQAFMLYGGEPCFQNQKFLNVNKRNLPNQTLPANSVTMTERLPMFMSTPMPNKPALSSTQYSGFQYGQPASPPGMLQSPQALGQENAALVFSSKHDGLYLFVSRMLRSIWQLNCVDANFCTKLGPSDCASLLSELRSLRTFLEVNSVHDISSSTRVPFNSQLDRTNGYSTIMMSNSHLPMSDQRNMTEQAQVEEKRSLSALNLFVKHACEVVSLWSILNAHSFQHLCLQLSPENQKKLRGSTFRDLMLTRSEVCAFLIISLINLYLKDKTGVSEVSKNLRELCPNLYRHEDAVTYKATELIMSAKNCTSPAEKEQKLRTTLQMCKEAAPTLPLQSICKLFISVDFFEGVVELAAICAAKSDPEEVGIHFYNNDEPSEDREGYSCFVTRMNYYKEVQLMLDHVYQAACNNNSVQDQTLPHYLCNTSGSKADTMESCYADGKSKPSISKIATQTLKIKDPLIHVTLYEWLLAHDMLAELLEVVEPTLGEFLRRSVTRNPDNVILIDLLWKYYEKNGYHSQASQILDNLAMTRSENITLEQRIEYLARAVMCMRNGNVGSSVTNGIFLKELEDKLEIARVQKAVLVDMAALAQKRPDATAAVKELNYALYDITQLYQHFAEPFNLWECQLSILNCSHHNDPLLIESVWGNIISSLVEEPGSTQDRTNRLFSKIELLVREYSESGACFPLAFLIRELEIRACQLRMPEGTVPEKLVIMNLDLELLLEYYSSMISMNERVWANEGNEWHLIQSAIRVVSLLADNAHAILYRSKRRIIGKAQDIVAACLNICYQKPDTNRLQQCLKELQCRLQRLLG
ncbi:nuclear pore complex protein Nup154 [Drosophila guanche]|uniref:Blast:Nuclear pore complex protein Nup155 n=1 Tax=Drosophila guanche TaxID=7266 RepID=A0A3B0K1F9_DROGU|nr:nuclear pore complex protein Nup154 [Drosophila guanche]SPP81700.1 blast:Nuclear pore complex protein Nup155 [Drosophila guanche]